MADRRALDVSSTICRRASRAQGYLGLRAQGSRAAAAARTLRTAPHRTAYVGVVRARRVYPGAGRVGRARPLHAIPVGTRAVYIYGTPLSSRARSGPARHRPEPVLQERPLYGRALESPLKGLWRAYERALESPLTGARLPRRRLRRKAATSKLGSPLKPDYETGALLQGPSLRFP